jgi:LacI family transcriptional regulator
MKKRITVADVARAAGVSMMTVSRAMNHKPGLSDELRQKILALADEMNFRPSQIARGLVTRQTSTIGLVIPDVTNPFFAQIARGVEDVAYEYEYSVFLINTAEELAREGAALDSLWQKEIDGAILCSLRSPEEFFRPAISRFPAAVLLNRELKVPLPNVITINVNDQRGASIAVQHLLTLGRKRIGFVAGPTQSFSSQRRLEGYKQALKNAQIPYEAQLVEHCQPDIECGRAAVGRLLARVSDLDALFAFNDLVAVGALQACQQAGKQVPTDLAIVGVDDIPLASIIRPQLTTLRVNMAYIGRLAMRTLLEIFEGGSSSATYQIEPELIIRESA